MPLKKVQVFRPGSGSYEVSVCPLGKWSVDLEGGGGCYDADPVEACVTCNFSDPDKGIDDTCQCPPDITRSEYDQLRKQYVSAHPDKSQRNKKGFQQFVRENFKSDSLDSRVSASPSK